MHRCSNARPAASFLTIFILTIITAGIVSAEFKANVDPSLVVPKTSEKFEIDGEFNDPGWRTAAHAGNFCEHSPGEMTEPAVNSMAMITYSSTHLYIAMIAWDDPEEVRASMRDRDNIFRDDYFGLLLDTYGDGSWGYELFVNPYGIQGDLRTVEGVGEDGSFDVIWESIGKVTDSGYQVEVAIPFRSLRFPDAEEHVWKATFWRDRQRETRYRYTWSPISKDDPCFICQWGTLRGITGIESGSNLEILPNVIGSQAGSINDSNDPNSGFESDNIDGAASLNVRYALSSNASLEMTLNPDFSQVESDAAQVDVNTNFALFYSERRPFFQEGSDIFQTPIDAVYTRSINNPQVAAKFTGRFGSSSVGYIFGYDENSPIVMPFRERSVVDQMGKSTSNIVRARTNFNNDSHVGFLATSRILEGGGSGSVASFDTRIRFAKNYIINAQTLFSYTEEFDNPDFVDTTVTDGLGQSHFDRGRHSVAMDGENFWGNSNYIRIRRSSRHWNGNINYADRSPSFRADNGFVSKNDYRYLTTWQGVIFRPNKKWLEVIEPSINVGRQWYHDAKVDLFEFGEGAFDEWLQLELYLRTNWQTEVSASFVTSREQFSGFVFDKVRRGSFYIDSRFSETVSIGTWFGFGRSVWRRHFREYDEIDGSDTTHIVEEPDLGRVIDYELWGTIRPTERFYFTPSFIYARMNHSDEYLSRFPDDAKEVYNGFILRSRFNYQFSREWYLRLVVQYNDFSQSLDIEPLLTYQINPFTIFYIGSTSHYRHYDAAEDESLPASEWALNERQFFFKLQYLFQM